MSKQERLQLMTAHKHMMELKGTQGHTEQVRIVREMETRPLTAYQQSA
jgi:hypothetical protein